MSKEQRDAIKLEKTCPNCGCGVVITDNNDPRGSETTEYKCGHCGNTVNYKN